MSLILFKRGREFESISSDFRQKVEYTVGIGRQLKCFYFENMYSFGRSCNWGSPSHFRGNSSGNFSRLSHSFVWIHAARRNLWSTTNLLLKTMLHCELNGRERTGRPGSNAIVSGFSLATSIWFARLNHDYLRKRHSWACNSLMLNHFKITPAWGKLI